MTSQVSRIIKSIRKQIYIKNRDSIIARIEAAAIKEEARAAELQKILEAKQRLAKLRARTNQLVKNIDDIK